MRIYLHMTIIMLLLDLTRSDNECNSSNGMFGMDLPGHDMIQYKVSDLKSCSRQCCDTLDCRSYVYVPNASDTSLDACVAREPCCFLKSSAYIEPRRSKINGIVSGFVRRDETTCSPISQTNGTDRPGSDYVQHSNVNNVSACAELCCDDLFMCQSYVYVSSAPSDFGSCEKGISCCYLKNANVSAVTSSLPGIISGTVKSNVPTVNVKWSFELAKGPAYTTSSPTLSDSKVYLGIGTVFYAVHRSNASLAFKEETDGNIVGRPVLCKNNTIMYGSFDGIFRAHNSETGEIKWKYDTHSYVQSSPVVRGDFVIFGTGDGFVYKLKISDGSLIWSVNLNAPILASGKFLDDDNIIFGSFSSDHNVLTCLRVESGDVVWSSDLNRLCSNGIDTNLAVSHDFIYITCQRAGGHSHAGGNEAFLVVANSTTGKVVWDMDLNSTDPTRNPLILNHFLLVSVGTDILSVDIRNNHDYDEGSSDHHMIAFRKSIGSSLSDPASDSSLVVVGSSQGDVFALNPESGAVSWAFQGLKDAVFHALDDNNGEIYVVTATSIVVLTSPSA